MREREKERERGGKVKLIDTFHDRKSYQTINLIFHVVSLLSFYRQILLKTLHTHTNECIYIHIYICVCVCVCVCTRVLVYVSVWVNGYVYVCVCVYSILYKVKL